MGLVASPASRHEILGLLGGDPGTFAVPDFQKEYDNVILFFIVRGSSDGAF